MSRREVSDRWLDEEDDHYDERPSSYGRGGWDDERGGGGGWFGGGTPLWRKILLGIGVLAGAGVIGVVALLIAVTAGLPSLADLQNYQPPVTSRVHAGDGALVAEFAREQRMFVPIDEIPDHVREAFIATEDQHFFEHSGIDYSGLARAMVSNIGNVLTGRRLEGASTITQQVAGNMLTGRAAACDGFICAIYTKLREGVMAQRIEKAFPGEAGKMRILELYLNQIYLGNRAYGVAAASLNYFDKPLSELTLGEAAMLGALPKAPSSYNPAAHPERALERRNLVLRRMLDRGFITQAEADAARAEPIVTHNRLAGDQYIASAHFVEEIRRQVQEQYGERALYDGGLSIRSTLDTRLQLAAAQALRTGLEAYDRRYQWRGPIGAGDAAGDIQAQLRQAPAAPQLSHWLRAIVTGVSGGAVNLTDEQGGTGRLTNDDAQWAAQGARREAARALTRGSIIYVTRGTGSNARYTLHQVPQIQGALVAMDPHTGRVLAMVGGYSFNESGGMNRATQALRQPGSSFKPIVYAAALDWTGGQAPITPATLIDDGPLAIEAGDGSNWSPENYTHEYYGPTPLRRGLEQSRNAMTARVAYEMGAERVLEYGRRFGIYGENTQPVFSLALGAGETTLMRMTTAYGMLVNGGRYIQPIIIDRIQDRTGRSIFRRDQRECPQCTEEWHGQAPPTLPDTRRDVISPITAYQIVSMAQGVVERGTAAGTVGTLGIPLGGKTGTTNDYKDAWFIGFSPDLVVGVWVGFDTPRNMGDGETGGRLAAPIFRDFMRVALADVPPAPFRIPGQAACAAYIARGGANCPGITFARIDPMTGQLATAETQNPILEWFRTGTEPTRDQGSSPFVFGGTDPIDPRALTGLNATYGSEEERQREQRRQQQQQSDDLGGLY